MIEIFKDCLRADAHAHFSPCLSETPLSLAVQSGLPVEGIKVLVQGGAHLDFRNRDGLTAVHKAVRAHNHAGLVVRTLNSSCMHANHRHTQVGRNYYVIMIRSHLIILYKTHKYFANAASHVGSHFILP